jgi:23S rRNA (uracil747-C5)-methyltransferase
VQTNSKVAEHLYATATSWAQELNIHKVCDIYCGHGPFSFHLEEITNEVLGIEVNEQAIEVANKSKNDFNYKSNFIASKAENLPDIIKSFNPNLMVVNPPRAGLRSFVNILKQQAPEFILYSSCNPETLKIDIQQLKQSYKIYKSALFDMFPQSEHFEVLVLLQK